MRTTALAALLTLCACGHSDSTNNPDAAATSDAAACSPVIPPNLMIGCLLEYATFAPDFIGGTGSGIVTSVTQTTFFDSAGFRLTMADNTTTGAKPFALVVAPLSTNDAVLQVWLFNPDGSNQSYHQIPKSGPLLFEVNAHIPTVRALDDKNQQRDFDFIHGRCEVKS
jgi:hypothetical protein